MKFKLQVLGVFLCILCLTSISKAGNPIDPKATPETKSLFAYLDSARLKSTLFGQQYALVRGIDWYKVKGKCEIKDVTADYPAVYGWDFLDVFYSPVHRDNRPYVPFRKETIELIKESYARNGIHTFSFHMDNLNTGRSSWDTNGVFKDLLPGGKTHLNYKNTLDSVADFFNELKTNEGKFIPIIYRPFHELNGKWFWWGKPHASKENFIALWKFTVDYLKNERNIHHLLYAYSTDTVATETEYLEYYPGDDYVDVMGIDIYRDVERNDVPNFAKRLRVIVNTAEKHGKIPALTETGYSDKTQKDWYTQFLLKAMMYDDVCKRIAFAVLWGNFSQKNYYSIYPGHFNENDFVKFYQHPFTAFEKELNNVYNRK